MDLDEPRDDETCVRVVSGSGADITPSSAAVMTRGRSLRGVMGGDLAPTVLLPRLLALHKCGRFRLDRLVRNYRFAEINTAIADSLSGETIKPVLTFG